MTVTHKQSDNGINFLTKGVNGVILDLTSDLDVKLATLYVNIPDTEQFISKIKMDM